MREGFTSKRCPRCGGNVFLDRDLHGWYEQCLQCSRTCYLEAIVEAKEKANGGSAGTPREALSGSTSEH